MPQVDQRLQAALAQRVDERLNRDVARGLRARKQLVQRAVRLQGRLLARGEDFLRLVLCRLNVWLVERIDAEDRAGNSNRELPAEELGADGVRILELNFGQLPIGPVRTFAWGGHEPSALLAG